MRFTDAVIGKHYYKDFPLPRKKFFCKNCSLDINGTRLVFTSSRGCTGFELRDIWEVLYLTYTIKLRKINERNFKVYYSLWLLYVPTVLYFGWLEKHCMGAPYLLYPASRQLFVLRFLMISVYWKQHYSTIPVAVSRAHRQARQAIPWHLLL